MKKHPLKSIVNKKVQKASFIYILSKIMWKVKETGLNCQWYVMPNWILTLEEQLKMLSYRSKLNNLQTKNHGNLIILLCQCGTEITNDHLYECNLLNSLEKKVDYSKYLKEDFVRWSTIWIFRRKKKQFEPTQAPNYSSWRH